MSGLVDALSQSLEEHSSVLPPLSDAQVRAMHKHAALLEHWNRAHNLTSLRDPLEAARAHWVDSLAGLALVDSVLEPDAVQLADVGSGAGFPGIPAALLWPHRQLTLFEAARKKASFLQRVVRELGLSNAQVVNARAESQRAALDAALTRATKRWHELPSLAVLLGTGGLLAAWVGSEPSDSQWADAASRGGLRDPRRLSYTLEGLAPRAVAVATR